MTRNVGTAHRDGPMRAAVPRELRVIDTGVLVATAAIALVAIEHVIFRKASAPC